ncbi:reverse transcriptase domain-containing protein [Bacteroides pyogenes]|uniref:reverse transcriptase domain-containing protein n=2 Tax=Bacteroides TaxID=816 RepID=UPI0011E3DC8D|nr:reverse transcriptase domain-containing protein [Bacteroides pyogenes]TYK37831.1 hypothetical protein FNJ61_06360 [Bacteroides pyogenes]
MPSISFIDRDKVVMKLIKYRCKLADKQSEKDRKNEFISRQSLSRCGNTKRDSLYELFPPRKQWCGIGKIRENLDSVARNERKLKYTYLKAKKCNSKEEWYLKLCTKADEIVRYAYRKRKGIKPPKVAVIEKKRNKEKRIIECRPVCSFPLELKIVLSLLNKYLTELFDSYFHDCSYAFRRPKDGMHMFQHLDAVEAIREYRKKHSEVGLYVAECDMQKFYDTISHEIIKKRFTELLYKAIKDKRINKYGAKLTKRWFFYYIDCFDFVNNVLVHNQKQANHPFWKNIKNKADYRCRIEWVDKRLLNRKQARRIKGHVGVPQGGSLSGLIANIVMHTVDNDVLQSIGDKDMLYCRFCDDMILIGVNEKDVASAFDSYNAAIKELRLIAHQNKPIVLTQMRDFWKGKTRGPYKWIKGERDAFPWVTFVGFDINWCGNLRIRKSSFLKQMKKQTKIANELLLPYLKGKDARYCVGTIITSLKSRLIATSVGRVTLWNYKDNNNIHSWMSAFSILDKNQWSMKQMQDLDRHRQQVLARAKQTLAGITCTNRKKEVNYRENHSEYFSYTGCPFSYYGQCFDYKIKNKANKH